MKMGHKKHGHCPYAQVEDAPKVLGHASILKGAVRATAGGGHHGQGEVHKKMAGTIIIDRSLVQSTEEFMQDLLKHLLHVGWRNFFSSCAVVSAFGSGGK
jgi:hypothetical protein